MSIKHIITAIGCAVVLTGCCSTCRHHQKYAKPLVGTTWHLVQLEGRDISLPADQFNLTILADGNLAGIGACNRLLGQYTTTEKLGISFGQVGSTMMFCPENGELETKFAQLLGNITHYDIDLDTLILLQEGTIKALLKAQNVEEAK